MRRLIPAVALLVLCAVALGQESPQATPAGQGQAFVAEAKSLPETIELSGVFEPAALTEVKIDLESFNQGLKVQKLARHGQQVKQGDVVLSVDPAPVKRALESAASRKAVAEVNVSKAKTDAEVAAESDALAKRTAERKLARAQEALSWFESVDGVAMLEGAEMMVQRSNDQVEDQAEELEQLRKMYQSEELTTATADIVIKRALRQLEYSKRQLELNTKRAEKIKGKDYADARQDLVDALDAQRLANVQLENDQVQRRVGREAGMLQVQEALRQATEEHSKLEADAGKLEFVAPADGYVFFGQLKEGNWAGANENALKEGDEIKPDQVVMTFYRPGAMRISVDIAEKDRFRLRPDAAVKVKPTVLPDVELEGKVASISPLAVQKGPARVFTAIVELAKSDDRITPGFSAKVELEADGPALPMVPAEYVKDGKLRVQTNGDVTSVDVKTGKTDGSLIQVTEGLTVGARVLPPEPAAPATDAQGS